MEDVPRGHGERRGTKRVAQIAAETSSGLVSHAPRDLFQNNFFISTRTFFLIFRISAVTPADDVGNQQVQKQVSNECRARAANFQVCGTLSHTWRRVTRHPWDVLRSEEAQRPSGRSDEMTCDAFEHTCSKGGGRFGGGVVALKMQPQLPRNAVSSALAEALQIFAAHGDRTGQCRVLCSMAQYLAAHGNTERAEETLRAAHALASHVGTKALLQIVEEAITAHTTVPSGSLKGGSSL